LSVSRRAHLRAAQAIEAYATQDDGEGSAAIASHLDVMDFVTPAFRKLYTDFYIKLVNKAPALWGYLYHASTMRRATARCSVCAVASSGSTRVP